MKRRESALAKCGKRKEKTLLEADYLLGVFDAYRMGALRFKENEEGPFLNDNKEMSAPPWTAIRDLEYASLQLEKDGISEDPDYLKWLNLLIAPGSSLGGARPKASVLDNKNSLWIAKFPSSNDDVDKGAWEMITNELAIKSGINIAKGMIKKFTGKHHTYLTKRFDRTDSGKRIHFASAMTIDINLALDVAKQFRVNSKNAKEITYIIKKEVKKWKSLAKKYKIPKEEQDYMSNSFLDN